MSNHLRHRRTKGIIAAACGVALLFTGGTFALWSDSAPIAGGTVKAGNLDLNMLDVATYDISTNSAGDYRKDQDPVVNTAGAVNLTREYNTLCGELFPQVAGKDVLGHTFTADGSSWNASPGETWTTVYGLQVALQGDNLVADLNLSGTDPGTVTIAPNVELKLDTWVQGVHAKTVTIPSRPTPYAMGNVIETLARLQAVNEPNGMVDPNVPGPIPIVTAKDVDDLKDGSGDPIPNVCVVMTASFDSAVPDQDQVKTDLLAFGSGLTVSLEQTRDPGRGHF